MAPTPQLSDEDRRRERQRIRDALALKALDEETAATVERVATLGAYAAVCVHVSLVAISAWLLTRGGSVRGPSQFSQIGAGILLFDALLCAFLMPPMVRAALNNVAVRAVLVATAAAVALTALPTVFVSVFGEISLLPFRHILYAGRGGLWMLLLLLIIACYGAGSVWLAWRLGTHPERVLSAFTGTDSRSS